METMAWHGWVSKELCLKLFHVYCVLWCEKTRTGLIKIYKNALLFAPLDPQNGVILVLKIKLVSTQLSFIPSMRIPHTLITLQKKATLRKGTTTTIF